MRSASARTRSSARGSHAIRTQIEAYTRIDDPAFLSDMWAHVQQHNDALIRSLARQSPLTPEELLFIRPVATRRVGRIPLGDFMQRVPALQRGVLGGGPRDGDRRGDAHGGAVDGGHRHPLHKRGRDDRLGGVHRGREPASRSGRAPPPRPARGPPGRPPARARPEAGGGPRGRARAVGAVCSRGRARGGLGARRARAPLGGCLARAGSGRSGSAAHRGAPGRDRRRRARQGGRRRRARRRARGDPGQARRAGNHARDRDEHRPATRGPARGIPRGLRGGRAAAGEGRDPGAAHPAGVRVAHAVWPRDRRPAREP